MEESYWNRIFQVTQGKYNQQGTKFLQMCRGGSNTWIIEFGQAQILDSLLVILFLNLQTIHMNVISRSPESVSTTHIMKWMIACIIFVFFAIIEYGVMLLCRFVVDYKSFTKDYAKKRLMQVDFISLMISMMSFSIFVIVFSTST